MTDYITVAQVDELLGAGWAGTGDPGRAVLMANTWLTNKSLPNVTPSPPEWAIAGAEVAREAAMGNLYGTTEYGVLSKSVEADGVSSSKTYNSAHRVISAGENFANAILAPWTGGNGNLIRLYRG
ncbi:hypothetical protein [Azotobacter vinelandii]|uniref:hypothetical protein n=1 Tax=Azotobacter vinelandii TaxID=354 RepID=UPI002665F0C4|nr:hypothetical protein [Azotobacter vinelandii]WKN20814.1 hypothetical protein AVAEIV_003839 [Azotobacter vinelandii]